MRPCKALQARYFGTFGNELLFSKKSEFPALHGALLLFVMCNKNKSKK